MRPRGRSRLPFPKTQSSSWPRSDGPTRCFFVRSSLQLAEDERQAKALWQAVDFLIHDRAQVGPFGVGRRLHFWHGRLPLVMLAIGPGRSRANGNAPGHAMQPTGQRLASANAAGLTEQSEKRGLKGVVYFRG